MPKNEFDFDDPLELNGLAFVTNEDTTQLMCDCFVEEFMRMGFSAPRIMALFRNPHYLGMNLVLQKHGEAFVQEAISQVFARWGRPVTWASAQPSPALEPALPADQVSPSGAEPTQIDPMGAPIPSLRV